MSARAYERAGMKNFNLDAILEAMLKVSDRVSDLNFSVGRPPQVVEEHRHGTGSGVRAAAPT